MPQPPLPPTPARPSTGPQTLRKGESCVLFLSLRDGSGTFTRTEPDCCCGVWLPEAYTAHPCGAHYRVVRCELHEYDVRAREAGGKPAVSRVGVVDIRPGV